MPMVSPPSPPPLPGQAVDSMEITLDPSPPLHVVVDIPDAEAPVVVEETTDAADAPPQPRAAVAGKAAAAAKEEEEEEEGSVGCCSGKVFLAILCVWLGGYVLAFFVWGVATGQLQVLLLLPVVATFVGIFLLMLRVYGNDSHPIHTGVDKRQAVKALARIIASELHEQERRRRERKDTRRTCKDDSLS